MSPIIYIFWKACNYQSMNQGYKPTSPANLELGLIEPWLDLSIKLGLNLA